MIGNLVRKYGSVIKRDYIESIIEKFKKVRELVFYRGDIEQIVDSYLHYDKLIDEFQKNIIQLQKDISVCKKKKYEILNSSVLRLRSEGKLGSWLNDLNETDLIELKNIVDIESEWRQIDEYRFNEKKKDRGRVVINY